MGELVGLIELADIHLGFRGPGKLALVSGSSIAREADLRTMPPVTGLDLLLTRGHRRARERSNDQCSDRSYDNAPGDYFKPPRCSVHVLYE